MKPGSDLDQGGESAVEADFAGGRRGDRRQQLEERALAGAIRTDDADRLTTFDREAHVANRPERVAPRLHARP
jgi:hypothetical protein